MIMPSKVIKPIDSLINISSYLLDSLSESAKSINTLHEIVNRQHYRQISVEKLLFCLDFLFMIDEIESDNETAQIKLKQPKI